MDLEAFLGIDPANPLDRRASRLVDEDEALLDRLVRIRKKKNLQQQDVADRMEISQSAVARIESGERDPRLSTLRRYALAVGAIVLHDVIDDEATQVKLFGEGGARVDVGWSEPAHVRIPAHD